MRLPCCFASVGATLLWALPMLSGSAVASPRASALVDEALQAEAAGDAEARRSALRQAVETDADHHKARWSLGYIQANGSWQSLESLASALANHAPLARYVEHRNAIGSHAKTQWELAEWCRRNALEQQRDAHLRAGSFLTPEDGRIQTALGRIARDNAWRTETEHEQWAEQRRIAEKSYKQWLATLKRLEPDLTSNDPAQRAEAKRQVLHARDPNIVPALEHVLSRHSEALALVAVEVLCQFEHKATTDSLIRHAVFSNWQPVRLAATAGLAECDPQYVLTTLISYLRPDDSGSGFTNLGQFWYWQDHQTTYVDLMLRVRPVFQAIRSRQVRGTRDERIRREFAAVSAQNERRIANAAATLETLTNEKHGADFAAWRGWFAASLDLHLAPDQEPVRTTYVRTTRPRVLATDGFGTPVAAGSCFAAGTEVWTIRGPLPIEQIELGELVLSQDVDSGELGYKPVVFRTLRPRTEMKDFKVGDETVRATLGHPIWVSGKGWVKVKNLEEGMVIHCSSDIHKLASITDGKPDYAYNLVVADWSTYFVGKEKILVHDNTPVTNQPRLVPGL